MEYRRAFISTAVAAALAVATLASPAGGATAQVGSLYQRLVVAWSGNNFGGHDRASFQIPGIGYGNVVCNPTTTWIQMVPSDRDAENDMWSVKSETKNGVPQTAVKDARVYEFSTPTSTIPHGTGASADEGFNQQRPIESAQSGSMVGLISRRGALNASGGVGVAPTSIHLSWSWSGFGSGSAQCRVVATFATAIAGPSRQVFEGANGQATTAVGPVSSFNLNWHGESEYPIELQRPNSLAVPQIGQINGVCDEGTDGEADLTLTPSSGVRPYVSATTYQGEGTDNSQVDDYYADPTTGLVGPIALPVNGFVVATVLPAWDAQMTQATQLLISSIRKTNDPDPASDYCEVSVQAITAPNPVL